MTPWKFGVPALLAAGCLAGPAGAQSTADEIAKYREQLAESNPAELWELRGEELWKTKRGPKNASLEGCDLGLGPGVVKGAYVRLPRYFADTDRVQDLESRLVTCMTALQGFTFEEATKRPFGSDAGASDMEGLVAWIAGQSRGMKVEVPVSHPKEKEAFELGRRIFFYRAGPYDFSCATCHSGDDKRIRLQELPNLNTKAGAVRAYTTWPAYRVSQGETRSMQWRMNDCFRQQRFPEPKYVSDTTIALIHYLGVNANGGELQAPAIKR